MNLNLSHLNFVEEIRELLGWDDDQEKVFMSDLETLLKTSKSISDLISSIKRMWGSEIADVVHNMIKSEIISIANSEMN